MSSPSAPGVPAPDVFGQILMISRGYAPAACLHVAAKLKIADLLAAGPKPTSELAHATQTKEDALYRVLRALASIEVFRETTPRTFANTPLSEAIRSDARESARDSVLFMADQLHMNIYSELMHTVETGKPAFKKITGMEPFEFFHENEEENKAFNNAMTSISRQFIIPVVQGYSFGESGTLADIGGGHGALMAAVLQKHRGLQGIIFDLPHVAEGARPLVESLGLSSRCQIVGGDFFKSVPAAQNYVMKSIIHDWEDEPAITILKNCASAMRGNGKVILLELVIDPGNDPAFGKWVDIEMLAIAGGRERTEAEYAALLAKAGLRLARIVRTPSPVAVIEAVKA